jgi:predicted acylesterase/phospholipase RssA
MRKKSWEQSKSRAYCLVLGGGGAKGVYHLGAWRALNELGIPIEAIVGNSIGAVMGAFMALDKGPQLEEIANNIGLNKILKIPEELIEKGQFQWKKGTWKSFRQLFQDIRKNGGLDTTPMREVLEKHIDEGKLRSGQRDFGLVTFNLSDRKPMELFIEDIPSGQLVDFLMASSAFPGFAGPDIDGKRYIDGGLHDNLPLEMAKKRGYRRFIVVDISAGSNARKLDLTQTETILITSREKLGGVFSFDRDFLQRYTRMGYLDTFKALGFLQGERVYLDIDPKENRSFLESLHKDEARKRLPKEFRLRKNLLSAYMELTIQVLGLERIRVWKKSELDTAAKKHLQEVQEGLAVIKLENWRDVEKRIRQELEEGDLIHSSVFYHQLAKEILSGKLQEWVLQQLEKRITGLSAVLVYLDHLGAKENNPSSTLRN